MLRFLRFQEEIEEFKVPRSRLPTPQVVQDGKRGI